MTVQYRCTVPIITVQYRTVCLLTNIDIPIISDHVGAEGGRQVEAGEEEAQHQPPMLPSHWPKVTPCPLIGPPRPRPHPVLYRCTGVQLLCCTGVQLLWDLSLGNLKQMKINNENCLFRIVVVVV